MDFSLTEEQVMFRNMAREFATRHIEPVAKDNDLTKHFPKEIIKELAPLGLLGVTVPQQYGGLEVDHICYSIIVEEIARACSSVAVTSFCGHAAVEEALTVWGDESQKQHYLPAMCSGEMLGCYAFNEPEVENDLASMKTTAVLNGEQWILNGTKASVTNGSTAQLALVIAQTDAEKGVQGLGAFLVERGTPGLTNQSNADKMGLCAADTADIILANSALPAGNLLGKIGDGAAIADTVLSSARFSLTACYVGIAQACVNASVPYVQERRQFGQAIARFDMIQEMVADMATDTAASRFLLHCVGDLKNRGLPFASELDMAKYYASRSVIEATSNAIQLHGGYGYTVEYPVERFLRDAMTATLWEGTPTSHKLAVARHALEV